MNRDPSRWLRKLAISCASLAVLLGAGEVIARVAGFAPSTRFRWLADAEVQYEPMPRQDSWLGHEPPRPGETRASIHINQHGQRGPDYALKKEADELRVIVLGDSLTMGQGVEDQEAFPAQLGAILADRGPGSQAGGATPTRAPRVINAGVNGWSTWHYMRWAQYRLDKFAPDVLVIGLFLGNDMVIPGTGADAIPVPLENWLRSSALYHFMAVKYRDYVWKRAEALKRGLTVQELSEELDRYAGKLEADLSPADQEVLWEKNSIPHLALINDLCRKRGIRLAVLLIPSKPMLGGQDDRDEPKMHAFLRRRLSELGIPSIECYPDLRVEGDPAWLAWDSGHLSPRGNAVVADDLAKGLNALGFLR